MSNLVAPRDLRDMMVEQKIEFADAEQIADWIGCHRDQVPARLRGARQAGEMVCVTRHGWVPVVVGRIDPYTFMDAMMRHLGHSYYLAGLSAAARHGASHQALQVAHFASSGYLSCRTIRGYARIEMYRNPEIDAFPATTHTVVGWSRNPQPLKVSSVEVTVFDLFALHLFKGSLSRETVACELLDPGPRKPPIIDAELLGEIALLYPVPVRQRVGFLLQEMAEYTEREFVLDALYATLPASCRTVEFEYNPDRSEPPVKLDKRWRVRQWYEMWPDV